MRAVEAAHRAAGATVQLAAIACSGHAGSLVLTAQLGRTKLQPGAPSASLLALVLPWTMAIVHTAVGEASGREPRAWLTPREADVLEHLVRGRSVTQIAEEIGRSRYTVHDHVKSLHRKLGVRTRAALVSSATVGVPPP